MQASLVELVIKDVDVFAKVSQLHYCHIQHQYGQMSFYKYIHSISVISLSMID